MAQSSRVQQKKLENLARLVRYYSLLSSTTANSGHPTSSLSATDLMTVLFFNKHFKYNLSKPKDPNNDRLIFSKGHASPLFYSLFAAAGKVSEKELKTYRKLGSRLEGHPTIRFPYTESPTGSLGQGLSIGVGMAINAKFLDKLPYKTYVLLGDSEMAEGMIWEAIQIAAHYKLNNLVGIIDVNRLGQCGSTMYGHNVNSYEKKLKAFDWQTIVIDGHDLNAIANAFTKGQKATRPFMIIAKTIKGKGVSFIENKNGWHGKALSKNEYKKAIKELGDVDTSIRGEIKKPISQKLKAIKSKPVLKTTYKKGEEVAPRTAYGNALTRLYPKYPQLVALDAEVSNSTMSEIFKKKYPKRFFEMFIAEQNMVGTAIGLAKRGKIPMVSSFAAFLTRAFDQIRMSQYSGAHIVFTGSHAGVSIGEDGSSQMALQDLAMYPSLLGSTVFYPADAVATEKCVESSIKQKGICYIRTTRAKLPVLYKNSETFTPGGSKTLQSTSKDVVTLIGAGVTLHEALKAHDMLKTENISTRVIDLYSIKPLDTKTLKKAVKQTKAIITIEDHFVEGGIGEAVKGVFAQHTTPIYSLAVTKIPQSGTPKQLLKFEGIDAAAIVRKVKKVLHT